MLVVLGCDQQPTNIKQELASPAQSDDQSGESADPGAGDQGQAGDPTGNDDAPPADDNAAAPEEEPELNVATFADMDAIASGSCAGCHGVGSGRIYIAGDEANAMANAEAILNRVSLGAGDVGVMPTSGPLGDADLAVFKSYLEDQIANQQ